jgi:predicted nucleotide-binding protein (sugar kinase/HSP70/actin superfamily)
MMETTQPKHDPSFAENIGKFHLSKKTILIPEMNRIAAHLIAASFKSFGMNAKVLQTYEGLELGMAFTSGKECYPCQVTMGDILYFVKKEQKRLGEFFNPEEYVYFLPESDGPCRFGMYNKYQRIILDSFPGLNKLKISSLTTNDGYSMAGMIEEDQVLDFRKAGYLTVVVADILDRLLWRIRPYEKKFGMADEFIEQSMQTMADTFETYGAQKKFGRILDKLAEIIKEGKTLVDPHLPRKPLIGIVGEIFLRMHVASNQNLIRVLEKHGAEVVNASLAEWINYVSYDVLRDAKGKFRLNLKQLRLAPIISSLKDIIYTGADQVYREFVQRHVYKRVHSLIDLAGDHKVSHLEDALREKDLFSFEIGTEAPLSIAGIVEYARTGYNGVVNVYPFTCMPGITTSAVVKPIMDRLRLPYLDAPYDSSIQPGREAAIRTFMYQAYQHHKRQRKKAESSKVLETLAV